MTNLSISVVVPAFNAARTVTAAINSALTQCADLEVIVVDDGSTDDTAARVRALASEQVTLLGQTNAGVSGARNLGAVRARGDYLLFLDGDDTLQPGALRELTAVIEAESPSPLLVRGSALVFEGGRWRVEQSRTGVSPLYPYGSNAAGTYLIERTVFLEIGGFNRYLHFGENTELLIRVNTMCDQRGIPPRLIPHALASIQRRPGRSSEYGTEPAVAARYMLLVHKAILSQDRKLLGNYRAIVARHELRAGRRVSSLHWYFLALAADPLSAVSVLRLVGALAPRSFWRLRDLYGSRTSNSASSRMR